VHHHAVQINQPTRCNSYTSLLLEGLRVVQHVSGASTPIIRNLNCINSLWFHRWSVGGSSVVGGGLTGYEPARPPPTNAATTNTPTVKPEAVNAVVSS